MAAMTVFTMAIAFTALGYVVYITYIFYMVEDNIEELRKKKLLHWEVKKEDVDEQVYLLFALPYMIVMCVAFAITGLTSVIFDYYTT
ncbi:hypothetical protein OESDEN_18894 [Oesophagostomum dentatum]|nr:hypothetical protein OESDEN_18894 [Oesophagostomum dentatum]